MARYCGHDITSILNAAEQWRDRCLIDDGSVFGSESLWNLSGFEELHRYFSENPDESDSSFFEKLKKQLNPAKPSTRKLAAEMLWVMFIIQHDSSMKSKTKRDYVREVWSWSGEELDSNHPLLQAPLEKGVAHPGTAYQTRRWAELAFFIDVLINLKKNDKNQRNQLLKDPLVFTVWLDEINKDSNPQLRHILRYLLFPDYFERIASPTHKIEIISAFREINYRDLKKWSLIDLDKEILKIREEQSQKLGRKDIDFYHTAEIESVWRKPKIDFKGMTKDITRENVIEAINEIDNDGIPAGGQSATYDLIYKGKRYPPKYILSLSSKYASGEVFERSHFSGGDQSRAFRFLRKLGFHIERKDFTENLITQFIQQADEANDLSTGKYPKSFCGLKVKVSFGKGTFAKIPWISFLGPGQKTQKGIYPGLLYYKAAGALILSYGISETAKPEVIWDNISSKQTIGQFLRDKFQVSPERYANSYVYKAYKVPHELNYKELTDDLDQLIFEYQQLFDLMPALKEENDPLQHWIFQANPKYYDLHSAIRSRSTRTWLVNQSQNQLKKGQKGFLWESGKDGGVVASGTLLTDPQIMMDDKQEDEYIKVSDKFSGEHLRAIVHIDKVLKDPISRETLQKHPVLKNLVILRFANATNYMIDDQQYEALQKMVDEREAEVTYELEDIIPPHITVAEPAPPPYTTKDALDGLFIDHEKFNDILSLFKLKKNLILQGPPGVGKTFFSKRLAFALMGWKAPKRLGMVQFHQSYSYEDFIQGYRPSGTGFNLKNGIFYEFCKKAVDDPNNKYVFIIDEINRGNLSKVFGELMMLIENDKRGPDWAIDLAYDDEQSVNFSPTTGRKFYVPKNLYLLGLMNTADRSLAMVDYALRRRFGFVDLEPGFETNAFKDFLNIQGVEKTLINDVVKKMAVVNDKIAKDTTNLGPGYCIGHSFFCHIPSGVTPDKKWYQQIIKAEIEPLLKEYWFDDLSQAESLIKEVLWVD